MLALSGMSFVSVYFVTRRLGCPLSPAELDGVLRCFDADGSGSIDFGDRIDSVDRPIGHFF